MTSKTKKSKIWSPTNVSTDKPTRYYTPDLIYGRKFAPVGKAGVIAGALQQPVEHLGRYAWEYYGGTEKKRALSLYYYRDFKQKYNNWTAYNYGRDAFQKTYVKKNGSYESSYRKLQASGNNRYQLYRRKRKFSSQTISWNQSWKRRYTSNRVRRKQSLQCRCCGKFHTRRKYGRY